MTTICMARLRTGEVLAGSDTWSGALGAGQAEKTWINSAGTMVAGVAGEALLLTLLHEVMEQEVGASRVDLAALRAGARVWARTVVDHPLSAAVLEREGVIAGSGLIGTSDGIFFLDGLGHVVEANRHFGAVGSGEEVASGALHALQGSLDSDVNLAKASVVAALRAAAALDAYTQEPFRLELLPDGRARTL